MAKFDQGSLPGREYKKRQMEKNRNKKGYRGSNSNEYLESGSSERDSRYQGPSEKTFRAFVKSSGSENSPVYKAFLAYYKRALNNLKQRNGAGGVKETPWLTELAEKCGADCSSKTVEPPPPPPPQPDPPPPPPPVEEPPPPVQPDPPPPPPVEEPPPPQPPDGPPQQQYPNQRQRYPPQGQYRQSGVAFYKTNN